MAQSFMLNPYPTDIAEPSNVLLQYFRSKDVPINTLVHAAYQVQGVVMGEMLPDNPVQAAAEDGSSQAQKPKGSTSPVMCVQAVACKDDEECCEVLETACGKKGMRGSLSQLILQQLLGIALQILQQYVPAIKPAN
jgi:hypothetical protein